jgi:5,10-methylenetetrahydromethanopterin reductase
VVTGSVNLIPEAPVADMVALAVLAESLGYQRCWLYDEGLATRDVYVTLAAIASATARVGLGTGITNPHTRHAATTAGATATLDELSGGRAFLGVGAGGSLTLDPLGVDRSRALGAVRELITACRSLFAGDTVTIHGETVRLRSARLGYPARTGIEIWLAGRGPRMLALGGEQADGVMLDFLHQATLAEQIARVRGAAAAAGRTVRIAYSTMIVADDAAMAVTKPHMTYRLVDSPPAVREQLGISDADVALIRRAMAGGLHEAAQHVRDEWVLPFVIAGSRAECAAELHELAGRHGIDEFVLPVFDVHHAPDLLREVAAVLGCAG